MAERFEVRAKLCYQTSPFLHKASSAYGLCKRVC